MKYLVLLVIVFVGLWWFRQQRRVAPTPQNKSGPQIMVACAHCGTHIPDNDAIHGTQGVYCSPAHRNSHES
jgi:uncharacterized protein